MKKNDAVRLLPTRRRVMVCIRTAFAVAAAIMFVAGCAVEVPKSALPEFRLTPPTESSATKLETTKPTE